VSKRKCKGCGERKSRDLETAVTVGIMFFCTNNCRIDYGIANARKMADKAKERREKKERKHTQLRKEKLKTASDYIKEAQVAVNRYVRLRDHNEPCISCGNYVQQKYGGNYDAGHFRSRGSASHLRFNTLNIHKQCVSCNRFGSGNVVDYRLRLIEKIGLDKVEKLEQDNQPRKFTIDYLKRVKRIFNKRANRLEKKLIK
jgi:hypothetical protein